MICCALAGLLVAVLAAWKGLVGRARTWGRPLRWAAAGLAATLVLAGGSAVAGHLGRMAAQTDALAGAPICGLVM